MGESSLLFFSFTARPLGFQDADLHLQGCQSRLNEGIGRGSGWYPGNKNCT